MNYLFLKRCFTLFTLHWVDNCCMFPKRINLVGDQILPEIPEHIGIIKSVLVKNISKSILKVFLWIQELLMGCSYLSERLGITNLRIYQYWIFHHTFFQICLGMLKPSEHEKFSHYSNHDSPYLKDCSEVRSADPQILFYYSILRIGGLVCGYRNLFIGN